MIIWYDSFDIISESLFYDTIRSSLSLLSVGTVNEGNDNNYDNDDNDDNDDDDVHDDDDDNYNLKFSIWSVICHFLNDNALLGL